jgi:restriction endonuclease S subunit
MGHISQEVLGNIPIILPPLEKQNEIAENITTIREKAKLLQEEAKTELEQAKMEVEKMILEE